MNPEELREQCNKSGRRNALTPESHHIEPIKQTEIQEKMTNLSVASTSDIPMEESSESQSSG